MTPKNLAFLKLYLGRDQQYHGNATQSYVKAYACTNERVAQTSGSRLLAKPEIAQVVAEHRTKAADNLGVDATFVLEQSLRVYDRAMGDELVEVDHITPKGDVVVVERRDTNLTIATKALELIGRHTTVQAFQDNVEHTHTHYLEQRLAARHKQIEKAAEDRPAIEGRAEVIDNETGVSLAGQEEKKRVHKSGGHTDRDPAPEKTTPERAGAPGK